MTDRSMLQRCVAELKSGLLELESHASLLKKGIFDLERHVDGNATDDETLSHEHNRETAPLRV